MNPPLTEPPVASTPAIADAPLPLSRLDAQRGLYLSIWEGVWATVFNVLTGGAILTGFALVLHASSFVMGLVGGLPAVVGLLQLPASLWARRGGSRRAIVATNAMIGRGLFLPILFVPFVVPPPFRLTAFLVLLTLSAAFVTITAPAWTSWMSDLVPPSSRGQYFGRRNMIAGIVSLVAPLPAGAFLDRYVKHGDLPPRVGFALLFAIGVAAAVASFVLLLRQPEPALTPDPEFLTPRPPSLPVVPPSREGGEVAMASEVASLVDESSPPSREGGTTGREGGRGGRELHTLTTPLADPNFRLFLAFAGLIACGQNIAGPFFTVWQLDSHGLALPYLTVQVLGAVAAGAGLLAMPVVGYLNDRFGSRPVLVLSTVCVMLPPLVWQFTTPGAYWLNVGLIVFLNLFSGAGWAGIGLGQFNLLLRAAPAEARQTYVALLAAATGLVGGVAPIVGGLFVAATAGVSLPLGPHLTVNNYKLLFLLATLLRVASLPILLRVRETDSRSTRFVMEQIVSPRSVNSYRALRRLRLPRRESERRDAVDTLATLRSPLALDELIAALGDVSRSVREHAAQALAAIGDPAAAPALIASLADPASGIGEAAANALGEIGARTGASDAGSVAALARAVTGPDGGVRVAAWRALGRLPGAGASGGDADGVAVGPSLLIALATPDYPTTCEAACGTLAAWGAHTDAVLAREAQPRLLSLLHPESASRGVRVAAARALSEIVGVARSPGDAVYAQIERLLPREPDAAVRAQQATALSRLGRVGQIPPGRTTDALLPLLAQHDMHGLACKQTLEALADAVLPPGDFYPYLNLPETSRDEAFQHILAVLHRNEGRRRAGQQAHVGADAADDAAQHNDWSITALARYASGDYAGCLETLRDILPPPPSEADHAPSSAAAASAAQLLRTLANTAADRAVGPEEALLALLLARAATAKRGAVAAAADES